MKKAFNLLEILLTITLIGVMAVGFLPVLTKRMQGKNSDNDPDCKNGFRSVQEVYEYSPLDQTFTVPGDIAGDVEFIMIEGGSPGGYSTLFATLDGDQATPNGFTSANSDNFLGLTYRGPRECFLARSSDKFYMNVSLSAVKRGEDADCDSGRAGASGEYIVNLKPRITKDMQTVKRTIVDRKGKERERPVIFHYRAGEDTYVITDSDGNFDERKIDNWKSGVLGEQDSTGEKNPLFGGVPGAIIRNENGRTLGVGQGCKYREIDNKVQREEFEYYRSQDAGCVISFFQVIQGKGGRAGDYASFSLPLQSGTKCTITTGAGGEPKTRDTHYPMGQYGEPTSVSCDGHQTYSTNNRDGLPGGYKFVSGQQGFNAGKNDISGGAGGSVRDDRGNIISAGGVGGCNGLVSSTDCRQPNGENGHHGSGGGGGSCSENNCGNASCGVDGSVCAIGGRGGDGVVFVRYKVQCQ